MVGNPLTGRVTRLIPTNDYGIRSSGLAITADSVKTKLLQDIRKQETAALYVNKSNLQCAKQASDKVKKPNKGPRCYICNKYGHISKNCRNKKKEQKSNENSSYVAVFSASTSNDKGWYVDSGAATGSMMKYHIRLILSK